MKWSNVLFFSSVAIALPSYGNDPFAELDQEMAVYDDQAGDSPAQEKAFQAFLIEQEKEYQTWLLAYLKEFDQFQQELVNKWGEGDVSEALRNVEFSDDQNVKSVVDYENEELSVAVLVDKNLSKKEVEKVVQAKIETLLQDKKSNIARLFGDREFIKQGTVSVDQVAFSEDKKQQVKDRIIKQTQAQIQQIDKQADSVQLSQDRKNVEKSQQIAIQEKAELIELTKQRMKKADSAYQQSEKNRANDKDIAVYKVQLPKNSLQNRAKQFVSMAEKEGKARDISPALVMAIMHSESAFDPRATSPIPAYGLMQIVPRTAGHDVNRLLRNIDKPMQKNDLYIPAVNVETGTAYLDILDKRYLKAIEDDRSRLYCTIAAYNTGAGNVARVFNKSGSRNINQAAIVINRLTADEVYEQLITKLPYDETRQYLRRVNSRIALYQGEI